MGFEPGNISQLLNLFSLLLYRNYVIMVAMFFTVSVINNYALNFNIAMPLHMIFRSVRIAVCLLCLLPCSLRPSLPPLSDAHAYPAILFHCRDR